jgi:hypothetical protein
MPSMEDMVQAHLLNVEREIKTLEERKVAIDQEIEKLQSYLNEGVDTLKEVVVEDGGENTTSSVNPEEVPKEF